MMFLDSFEVEIKPNCSVSKPLYSKSKKGHYLQNTCHFERINTLSWKPLRKSLLFSVFPCIRSFSMRNGIRWHAPSNVSHRAKLWRAVPVSLDAPSFTKDTVMVYFYSPAVVLWEQSLTVLPVLFRWVCKSDAALRPSHCYYNLHFCGNCKLLVYVLNFLLFLVFLHKLILWTKTLLGLENGRNI